MLRGPCLSSRFPALVAGAWLAIGLSLAAASNAADATAPRAETVPVIVVPGATGSALVDTGSGRRVWGEGRHLLAPRDHGYRIALPLDGRGDALAPDGVIEELRLTRLVRKPVYGPIATLLEDAGYRRGSLDRPLPGDSLFLFDYDWRRSSVEAAHRLAVLLEAVRRARGVERLTVDLVCQSNGGLICRYLAKYGGEPLPSAETGLAGLPPTIAIRRLLLVGTSSCGSLRILRELDRGRRYVPWVGRWFTPETLFSFPALFEDLPLLESGLVVDGGGRPLPLRLDDPRSWERHGWSIFSPAARKRIASSAGPDAPFGNRRTRLRYLAAALDRARRLHRLLGRDVSGFSTRYDSIQNVSLPTPGRAVLARRANGLPILRFTGDRWLARRPQLEALATTRGDGHASVASQGCLSPQERAALVAAPLAVSGSHFELILAPATRRRLLAFLHGELE